MPIGDDPIDPDDFFDIDKGGKIESVGPTSRIESRDHSGIGLDRAKLALKPVSFVLADGHRERWRKDEQQITEVYIGAWGERAAFVEWVLGSERIVEPEAPTGYGSMARVVPAQHPEYPWLYATEAEVTPAGGAIFEEPLLDEERNELGDVVGHKIIAGKLWYIDRSSNSDQNTCKVQVTYRSLPYTVRTDQELLDMHGKFPTVPYELQRYVTRERTYAVNAIPLPGLAFKWAEGKFSGASVPENAVQLLFPTGALRYTWHSVPVVPDDAISSCEGKVNKEPFDGAKGARTYPPGTLLCQAPQVKLNPRSLTGARTYDITYVFLYRPTGWNKLPDADGDFNLVTRDGTPDADTPYKEALFDVLFFPPIPVEFQ
ncbi:MAG: hypothetical protein IT429_25680 [Gemmataceae bacterium]|nr:hypothetical protein [Gemmataceae bacterium]